MSCSKRLFTSIFLVSLLFILGCSKKQEVRLDDLGCYSCVLWERYTMFSIRADGRKQGEKIHFQYRKHVRNVRIDVSRDRFLAFSVLYVPGAGYFYQNVSEELGCKPDIFEQLLLQAKVIHYIFSQAFPDGPNNNWSNKSFSIVPSRHQAEEEFTVKTGTISKRILKWNPPWGARGQVKQFQDATLSYQMLVESDSMPNSLITGQTITGEWSANEDVTLVEEYEPLKNWRACYTGIYDYDKDSGKKTYVPDLINTQSFRTFGDVFAAVKDARYRKQSLTHSFD